jgi:acetylornithine deacetylase/succinyl-diaminopimelate desuccinylase-like protein
MPIPRSRPAPALCLLALLAVAVPAVPATPTSLTEHSPEAGWLADYLRIDSSNPPGREAAAAEYLASLLHAAGLATERHVTPAGRVNLVARLPATVPGAPWIALVHHLDVVPAGEGWRHPPFGAEIEDGELFGRGAVDIKSLGIAHLAALLDAARLPVRRRGLLFLAVADEEAGGGEGLGWLIERRPELFAGVEAALGEGGLNRTVVGRTHFFGVEVAQKRAYWLELVARGRGGHGSSLNPESAAHQLVRALARVVDRPRAWRLEPPVERFLAALLGLDPGLAAGGGRAADAVGPDGPAAWLPPGYWGLLLDTVQVTGIDAGEPPNVVAAEARARLDVRLLPGADADAFLAELGATLGDEIEIVVRLATPPSAPSALDTAVGRALVAVLERESPVVPVMIPGITDSRFLRERGIAAYGVSPFELESDALRRVHAAEEFIPLAAFDRGVTRTRRIVRALVAPDDRSD